jgi:threonine/homoserine/homoserine lactone efflux protein
MISALLYGLSTGFVSGLMLGTVFFTLLQISIDNGYRTGFYFASGVITSDTMFVLIALFGTSFIPHIDHLQFYASLAGGVLLCLLGGMSLVKKNTKLIYPKTQFGHILYFFGKGFLLNTLNPVNFLIWAGIVFNLRTAAYTSSELFIFFTACLGMIFLMENGIAYFSHNVKKYITASILILVNRVTGIALFVLGGVLLWEAVTKYW